MSRSSSRLRGLGLAGLATLASLAAAPSAGAVAYTVDAQCTAPLPGRTAQPVKLGIDVPATVKAGNIVPLKVTSFEWADLNTVDPSIQVTATFKADVLLASVSRSLKADFAHPLTTPANAAMMDFTGEQGLATVVPSALYGQFTPTPPPGPNGDDPLPLNFECSLPVGTVDHPTIQILPGGDSAQPTTPGQPTFELAGPGAVTVSWGASTDNVGVSRYVVTVAGASARSIEVTPPQTSTTITGLVPGELLDVYVNAFDAAGNSSFASRSRIRLGDGVILDPYGVPVDLNAVKTSTTVMLSWGMTSSAFPPPSLDVLQDGVRVKTVSGVKQATITGLTPGKTYTFGVASMSGPLQLEPPTPITVTLPSSPVRTSTLALAGGARVKTFASGTFPLNGLLGLDVDKAGAVVGDLAFVEAPVSLLVFSFLPISARAAFVPSGRTTGTYAAGVLQTTTKVRIKMTSVRIFGTIPLLPGNGCQTRKLTDLNLTSAPGFSLQAGGTLSGKFAISDLNGCGLLEGLVNPLTSSTGNTITLQATPAS